MRQKVNISSIRAERTTPVAPEDVAAMAQDIKLNGLQRPLIIDRYGVLIDGLLRLRALQQLGAEHVQVDIADNLHEAIELINALGHNFKKMDLRRRRDFAESLEGLITDHIAQNMRRREKGIQLKTTSVGTREMVSTCLSYGWHRLRTVYRWLEEDSRDPERQELLKAMEAGEITFNYIYAKILPRMGPGRTAPASSFAGRVLQRKPSIAGDITGTRSQIHLMQELNRQLSGALKGARRLGLPIQIPSEDLDPLLDELIGYRRNLSSFINSLRKVVRPQ